MAQPLTTDAIDLLLGSDNDLVADTDFHFVFGVDGVAQLCRIAVQMFAGEWFLDLDIGIPYWDAIFGSHDIEVSKLAALVGFRQELLAVPGVLEIIFLNVEFTEPRTLTVSWQVRTAAGNTELDTLSPSARSA